jgi:hypothetical protein
MGVVNTTYTFTATDTITSTKMNNIIDQTTITTDAIIGTTLEVASGKLKVRSLGITSNELGEGSVTSYAIVDGTIVNADISLSAAIAPSKLGSGAIPATATVTTANIIDASVTAPKLSGAQTGAAPVYGARAWVNFDADRDSSGATNTSNTNRFIRSSGNVSSVLKTATGKFTVTMTTELPNTNYAVVGTAGDDGAPRFLGSASSTQTTTQFFLTTDGQSGDVTNSENNSLVVFG